MSGTVWLEVRARFEEAPDDWSIFADAFDRFGCPGSLVCDDPPAISGYLVCVSGSRERANELSLELKRLGACTVEIAEVKEEDWSETWRAHFKLRRVGKRFVVRPTWEGFDAGPEDLVIVLDPGQAFGTGDHPTTRMCIELMESAHIGDKSVLDLGCGSGILSIAAAKLGASKVLGADIEEISVEVAKQNGTQNEVDAEFVVSDGFGDPRLAGPWDVIVSNIISATLIRMAHEVVAHLVPGGMWIVSGIIEQNWEDVRTSADRAGFALESKKEEDGWVAACFRVG